MAGIEEIVKISIGVHVYAEPNRLHATIESIQVNTPGEYELLLLPDGPDSATKAALAGLSQLRQLSTVEPYGPAVCFNRLATNTDSRIIVFLESGSLVGPGWLDHLTAALEADPRNGLTGPSTNQCWNAQCVYPNGRGDLDDIAQTARDAQSRFGDELRTLEPLHSLADFCYAVRRDVIERVGAADEEYGLGPCWEMDYNIRAARAGFRGVWACAAYVHRSPCTRRRRAEETRRFLASKQRYQDKFCGGRIRGEKRDYRQHCRGDECPNFAPADLIPIHLDFGSAQARPVALVEQPPVMESALLARGTQYAAADIGGPLVTCIMPTCDRKQFVPQAIRSFLRQDYPNAELLIVDDSREPIADLVPRHDRIRLIRLERKLTVGAKRNLACEQARGELIVHWDDDDWYPPWRITAQVRALAEGGADLCGSSQIFYVNTAENRGWEYRYEASGVQWVGGNTLAYHKRFWERNRFQDLQVGEDSRFLWSSVPKKVADLKDPSLCVGMIHRRNTSPKTTVGQYWKPFPLEEIRKVVGDDLYFYLGRDWPLVSCIMPTRNRQHFLSLALSLFLGQDYPNKELVIIDDSSKPSECEMLRAPGIRYIHSRRPLTIGAKRNLACRNANGEIIAHWDDDDWYSSDRLRYQAAPIVFGEADLTGLYGEYVLKLPGGDFWTLQPKLHQRMFVGNVHGGTLVYSKRLIAEGIAYPEINLAEDAHFLHSAMGRGKRLTRLSNPVVFIYVRHTTNAWREFAPGRFIDPSGWHCIETPPTFNSETLSAYRAATQG
jgi:O-antigen biosynthesis protein